MKQTLWILLSLGVLALAYSLTGTSSMVSVTNDIGTFCRAAGFVSIESVMAAADNERRKGNPVTLPSDSTIMSMPRLQLAPDAKVNTVFGRANTVGDSGDKVDAAGKHKTIPLPASR